MKQINAAGNTMRKFVRNLSRIEQFCVFVAATVVSEINERLSPKNEPPTTAATIKGSTMPEREANSDAIGTRATMVPTEVPMQIDTMHEARKSPANKAESGKHIIVRSTVADTAPIALADEAKAPASTNIHTISSKSGLPAPCEKQRTRSSILYPRNVNKDAIDVSKNTIVMGTFEKSPIMVPSIAISTASNIRGIKANHPRRRGRNLRSSRCFISILFPI